MLMIRLLGSVEIEKDGGLRPYGARKYAALLALLVLNPRRIFARAELAERLWPESSEAAGRAALRTALGALRKTLGPESLLTTRETAALAPESVTTDVALLEQGARRLNLASTAEEAEEIFCRLQQTCRGPLLPGRYEDWIVRERERIDDLMRAAQTRCEILHRTSEKEWPPTAPGSASAMTYHLPAYGTRFLGRERESEALLALLTDPAVRLVTLTGTAGIGKTRLAVETAHRLRRQSGLTVCFVALAACTEGGEILPEVARSLSPDLPVGVDWEQSIARSLARPGRTVLVLDNAEQLVRRGAAKAVHCLRELSPSVTVLVTSRQVLQIEGERRFPLAGLTDSRDTLLFLEQAQCVRPEFAVTDMNRAAVEQLCARLEGIPLAIELCAAWAAVLTPEQILGRMDDRFALLKSRRAEAPPRHRSLHAALEWGCPTDPDLLPFFLALSVFRGGFTLEAAEAVAGGDALEQIALLREQSLLAAETGDDGKMRYHLLETIREFADGKLAGETRADLHRRHLAHFHAVAERVTPLLTGADAAVYHGLLERENPNFRAAIERGLADKGSAESVVLARSLILLLRWFWGIRGHRMPIETWLKAAFERREEIPALAQAWLRLDYAHYLPHSGAARLCEEALALFETHDAVVGIAMAHENLGRLAARRGDTDGLMRRLRHAAVLRETTGDTRGAGYVLAELANVYFETGDSVRARGLWAQCRAISESLSDIGSLAVLDRAEAVSLLRERRAEEALPLFDRAIATFRLKGETWHLMDTLERCGEAHALAGRSDDAVRILAEALYLAEERGDTGRISAVREKLSALAGHVY